MEDVAFDDGGAVEPYPVGADRAFDPAAHRQFFGDHIAFDFGAVTTSTTVEILKSVVIGSLNPRRLTAKTSPRSSETPDRARDMVRFYDSALGAGRAWCTMEGR